MTAVTHYLKVQGLPKTEIKGVCEGLKVVRDGNFFKWQDSFYNQISGCALGDPDSCSYSDISMAYLLDHLIPECERQLSINLDPFFKVYRDDGLGIIFVDPNYIQQILEFFNAFNESIQWTVPKCSVCSLPEASCQHYENLEFLDCKFTWKQVRKGDQLIWQFSVKCFSKTTDCHAYLSPTSCSSPHLNKLGVSVAKTVGTRLRTIHSNDEELLLSLNLYSGYLIARGYDPDSIKYHFSMMANRSRLSLIKGEYKEASKFISPIVTNLHPATTVLSKIARSAFDEAHKKDPLTEILFPKSSLVVAYRKLPNLQFLLCKNDQNSLANRNNPQLNLGYWRSNCRCNVCKASKFGKYLISPALPNYSFKIPEATNCKSGPHIVYYLVCKSGRPECSIAHYVGRAHTSDASKSAMGLRWSVHKYQFRNAQLKCGMTHHLHNFHRGEDPQKFVQIQIIQTATSLEEASIAELRWQRKLFAFHPTGLCRREEHES